MATIRIYDGTNYTDVEVTEEFAVQYAEMEHREYLVNRKETRRHQSLDKSMEHGFDVVDPSVNVLEQVERRLLSEQIHTALHKLTDKQRAVVSLYFFDELNYREIGERLHIGTSAVFDHYQAAIKKLKNFWKVPEKHPISWLLGEGLRLYLIRKELQNGNNNATGTGRLKGNPVLLLEAERF